MCCKYGEVEEVEIFFYFCMCKYLGLVCVFFMSIWGVKEIVKNFYFIFVMGNIIYVQFDIKG